MTTLTTSSRCGSSTSDATDGPGAQFSEVGSSHLAHAGPKHGTGRRQVQRSCGPRMGLEVQARCTTSAGQVAEGVDQEEQAKVLRLLRCDELQGYLFSKPLPPEQMTAMLIQEKKS